MSDGDWLQDRFEENRAHLRKLAFRMLGSPAEADDAVQEAWVRLGRADAASVENLGGWLTTVVARVCLDMLRSRKIRREEPLEVVDGAVEGLGPARELELADSLGPALLVLLETLAPAERVAFVLHDLFDLPFEEIAPIVGRSATAARQLASRARRRIRRGSIETPIDRERQREVVGAFLTASRDGNFDALLSLLDPSAVLYADEPSLRAAAANAGRGAPDLAPELHGAATLAGTFNGRARGALPALIDGEPGAVWAVAGKPRAAFLFAVERGKIVEIELVMEPDRLAELAIEIGQRS
jgi:RNA polymerase sigma-70 factor (ECF subfamily)